MGDEISYEFPLSLIVLSKFRIYCKFSATTKNMLTQHTKTDKLLMQSIYNILADVALVCNST